MKEKYVAPKFVEDAFNCPHCGAYAHQMWFHKARGRLLSDDNVFSGTQDFLMSICARCRNYAFWRDELMIYPISSIAPLPVENIPEDVKIDFLEARDIVNASPRAAAALLRLALQKLMAHLGEKGKILNDDIANLVKKGLPPRIQKALDVVRVIGNNAVHPGMINLKDDTETAIALFELLNMIVDVMITQPKRVEDIYTKIPNSTKKAIKQRDKKE